MLLTWAHNLEEGGTPAGGTVKRDAGEGSHTVAPPWTKYHKSQTGRGRVVSRGRASLDEVPQKPQGPCRSRRRGSLSRRVEKEREAVGEWMWTNQNERDPHGVNQARNPRKGKTNGEMREGERHVCVLSAGQDRPR